MAHSSRTWRGARTPQALKRVRQSARRHAILQPRRTAAKTYIAKAAASATQGDVELTQQQLTEALSALDRAAKVGAIHPNAAARRKSRLMLKVNAALGGEVVVATGKVQRQTGKAAAAKAAKARIAATKATKAKGEQTAAGKARAALSRSTRTTTEAAPAETPATPAATTASTATPKPRTRASSTTKATGGTATKASTTRSSATSPSTRSKSAPKS